MNYFTKTFKENGPYLVKVRVRVFRSTKLIMFNKLQFNSVSLKCFEKMSNFIKLLNQGEKADEGPHEVADARDRNLYLFFE